MVQNRQKVKVDLFTFWQNLAIFVYSKSIFSTMYTSNEAQTKLKTLFKWPNELFWPLKKS